MLAQVDPIGKIKQLYMEGRPVPYLTFMHVFNALLADPVGVKPKEPGDWIAEPFRAACMACNVGVFDTEGRAEERVEEFRTKVYPYWKSKLSPAEFRRYESIYSGKAREEVTLGVTIGKVSNPKANALLERLKLVKADDSGTVRITPGKQTRAAAGAVGGAAEGEGKPAAPTFADVDEMCRAMHSGELKVEFAPMTVKQEFARYRLGDVTVGVRLVWGKQKDRKNHALLTAAFGYAGIADADARLDKAAAEMGYTKRAAHSYVRWDDDFGYTLKVGPNMTNIACSAVAAGAIENALLRIRKIHRDLAELIERLQG